MKTAESCRAVLAGLPLHYLRAALNTRGLAEPVRNALKAEILRRSAEPAKADRLRNLAAEVAGP